MHTNKTTFDELDKKCIQELPLMVDVISSTFNKIKVLFTPFYDEVKLIVKDELKKKRGWYLAPRDLGIIFYPFTSEEITNVSKISNLSNFFGLWGGLEIYSGGYAWNRRKGSFYIQFAFEYEVDDDGKVYLPYSYFAIENFDVKKFGTLSNKKFYNALIKSIKKSGIESEFEFPDEHSSEEGIWIFCIDFNADKITIAYNNFRDKILLPFIRQLK